MDRAERDGRDWRHRAVPARDAVRLVGAGDHVFVGSACATPRALVAALEDYGTPVSDVHLVHFLTDGVAPVIDGRPSSRFRHTTYFVGRDLEGLVGKGAVDYVPVSVRQAADLIESGRQPIDVAFVQVAPPDADGVCSLGVSVDLAPTALSAARTVVAEVNPNMPRTAGGAGIRFEDLDAVVEVDTPVIEYLHDPADEVGRQVARYVARIIDDGATLQVGLGRIPNEMLRYLTNRKDLGIHSDVITEPIADLMDAGVLTGQRKHEDRGVVVASYCMGTRRLYDLVDSNPAFSFRRIEDVVDEERIAAQPKMVSVTQAFSVDLTGQVCADQFHGGLYGGISSQPEFTRGAAAAQGGKAIVCLASTVDDGSESRIRPRLEEGEGVTLARSDVHFVVTEFGIAYLYGKPLERRALALIEIAAPRFREPLLEEAKALGLVRPDRTLKSRRDYPAEEERPLELRDGSEVLLRPTRSTDVDLIRQLFYDLPAQDVYTRFFTNLQSFSTRKAQHLSTVGYETEMAYVAVVGDFEDEVAVGSCCYFVDESTRLADVAFMVHPDWQGRGLGGAMLRTISDYAERQGLAGFTADVLAENAPMLRVFERSGLRVERHLAAGAYEVEMRFA